MKILITTLIAMIALPVSAETLKGTLELHIGSWNHLNFKSYQDGSDRCESMGGFRDIGEGTRVTIADAKGEIIATGSLGSGTVRTVYDRSGTPGDWFCGFPFSIEVPPSKFYSIRIGGDRGSLNYSAEELTQKNWTIQSQIGW